MEFKDISRETLKEQKRLFHWPELQELREEEAKKTMLYETPYTIGAIWAMKPGHELPIHSHENADDIWIVMEGKAEFYGECNERTIIEAGDIVVSRPGEKHGMVNTFDEDFVMLGIAGPTPIGFIPHEHK